MLALVEGRHATGENVFRVTQMTSGDTKSDDEDNEDERDGHGITCDNSFEGTGSAEQPFSDWVCSHLQFSAYDIK
jgi:hypothetical protein